MRVWAWLGPGQSVSAFERIGLIFISFFLVLGDIASSVFAASLGENHCAALNVAVNEGLCRRREDKMETPRARCWSRAQPQPDQVSHWPTSQPRLRPSFVSFLSSCNTFHVFFVSTLRRRTLFIITSPLGVAAAASRPDTVTLGCGTDREKRASLDVLLMSTRCYQNTQDKTGLGWTGRMEHIMRV